MGKNNAAYGGPRPPRPRERRGQHAAAEPRPGGERGKLAYVVVEPGVSFFDLCAELQRRGSRLWASIPDLGWGSVIGNTLDHGVGYLPGGNHADSQCGMEVVLGSGEVIRTGMGAMAGNPAWHAHRRGFGPAVDSLFMQSNFGIVTKTGKWLTPRPEVYVPVEVQAPDESDFEAVIDTVRPLLLDGTVTNVPLIGTAVGAASMVRPRAAWHDGDGPLPAEFYARAAAELGMGYWNLRLALYGPEAVVDAQLARVKAAFAAGLPGSRRSARKIAGTDVSEETVATHPDRVQAGVPELALLDSSPVVGRRRRPPHSSAGRAAAEAGTPGALLNLGHRFSEVERAGPDFWPGTILTPCSFYSRSATLLYDTTNEAQVKGPPTTFTATWRPADRRGGLRPVPRPHIDFMDDIAAQYD